MSRMTASGISECLTFYRHRLMAPDLSRRAMTMGGGLLAVALVMRELLEWAYPGLPPFITLFPALVVIVILCGFATGCMACAVGLAAAIFLWIPPRFSFVLTWSQGLTISIFVVACIVLMGGIAHAGTGTAIVACGEDVTKLRGTVKALQLSEARFRAVLQQIPAAVAIVVAPDGEIVLRSERSQEILGHESLSMHAIADFERYGGIHDDGTPYATDDYPIVRALRHGETVEGAQLKYRRPDDGMIMLEVYAAPIRDAHGDIVAALGLALDIPERLRAEQARLASQRQLDVALQAGQLGVWQADRQLDRTTIDARVATMLGLGDAPCSVSSRSLLARIHRHDRADVVRAVRKAVDEGASTMAEFRWATPDGAIRWFASQGKASADGTSIIGVIRDVTDRRHRIQALHDALAMQDLLIREADHRIKNSLQLVISLLAMQMRGLTDVHAIDAIKGAISRVAAIAESHVALQNSSDLRMVDLASMLTGLAQHFARLNPVIRIECRVDGDMMMDVDICIPLSLVTSELITNALRHAFEGRPGGLLTIDVRRRSSALQISVADDGVGFEAVGALREGLGSNVIRMLSRQIGADVTIRSVPNAGTTIQIVVPLAVQGDAEPRRMVS